MLFGVIPRNFSAAAAAYLTCVKRATGALADIYFAGPSFFRFQASQTTG
jgi:hypothetical protein